MEAARGMQVWSVEPSASATTGTVQLLHMPAPSKMGASSDWLMTRLAWSAIGVVLLCFAGLSWK